MQESGYDTSALQHEATTFARYLLGHDTTPQLKDRYIRACGIKFDGPQDGPGSNSLKFALKHPFFLPAMDAANGFFRPKSILREKLLLMTAILEASPDHAEDFLPRICTLVDLVFGLMWCVLSTGVKLLVGIAISFTVLRGRI